MPTKARGPLVEDYNRAIKAAEKHGWEEVSVKFPHGYEITLKKKGRDGPPAKPNDELTEAQRRALDLTLGDPKKVKLLW